MSTYQTENSKLLWMIIGGISVVVVLFLAVQWFLSQKDQQSTTTAMQPVTEKTITSQTEAVTSEAMTATSEAVAPVQLVEESIVKTPLPTNDSLAKEEIAKLDDIHQQLQDQRYELKQQHNDIDTLLKLKEDQIKLMEAKIAAQDKS